MEKLMIGTGKSLITPPFDCELSGFVAREGRSCGVHDHLYARAVMFCDGEIKVALVSVDLIGVDNILLQRVREQVSQFVKIDPHSIVISATHTHSGPATLKNAFLGQVDSAYYNCLVMNIVAAVHGAERNLEAVRLFVGTTDCYLVGKNRRQEQDKIDPQVLVLRFQGKDGAKAILVNYACHPVVLGPDNHLVTADFPFYLIDSLEKIYPDALVMFVNGATGDVNVGHNTADSIAGKVNDLRTFKEAARLGRILAGLVLCASESAKRHESTSIYYKRQILTISLEELYAEEYYRQQMEYWKNQATHLREAGAPFGEYRQAEIWSAWADIMSKKVEMGELDRQLSVEVVVFSVGNVEFVTLPGEFFHDFSLNIKQERHPYPVFVCGYSNGNLGYVVPESGYDQCGYELCDSFRYYGLPSRLEKGTGEKIVCALLSMLNHNSLKKE